MSSRVEISDEGIYVRVDNKIGSSSVRDAIKGVQRILTSKGASLFGEQHSTAAPALWLRSAGQLILFERWTGTTWARVGSLSNTGVFDVVTGGDFTIAGVPISAGGGGGGTPASTVTDETSFGIAKAVGTGTNYARDDHTHGSPAAPAVPRKVTVARARITAGDITLPNTSSAWALLSTSSIPELSISGVQVGDEIEIGVNALSSATTNHYFDIAVVTGGTPTVQRYMATGTSSPALEGNPGFYPALSPIPGTMGFTAASGDIDSGSVRLRIACLSGGARTLYASTSYPFFWQVKVIPQ